MQSIRNTIGGLGNILFKEAFIYSCMRSHQIPDIYVQDEKYFAPYAEEIKQRFGVGITTSDYVGIHVRRGDYVNNPFHWDLSESDYYTKAMCMFVDKKFLVFSDDVEWCKTQEIFKDCSFATGNSELEDFNMLASCESQIIANSSFSWWAAYLNPNPDKRVIAPREDTWFRDGIIRTKVPSEWEQI